MRISTKQHNVARTFTVGLLATMVGAAVGFWAAGLVPSGTLISILKYSTVLLGIVWAFSMIVYNKLSDLTDVAGIDYKQHRGLESAVRLRLQWFWFRALILALAGLVANVPMFLRDGGTTPGTLSFSIATGSLALALILLRRVWAELEEIRALRSEVKELERREKQRAEQIASLREGVTDWKADPQLGNLGKTDESNNDG